MVLEKKESVQKSQIIQIIFLIVLVIAVGALIYSTLTIVKYRSLLTNPLGYNLQNFGINYCRCIDNYGKIILVPSTNFTGNLSDLESGFEIKSSSTLPIDLSKLNFTKPQNVSG